MFRSGIHLQSTEHLHSQLVFWQHTPDGVLNDSFRMTLNHSGKGDDLASTGVVAVAFVSLCLSFVSGESYPGGVGDDDKITTVDVGRIDGFVLSHQ